MKLKLRDACYNGIKGITKKEIKYDESYQKAVKEANQQIEESREKEYYLKNKVRAIVKWGILFMMVSFWGIKSFLFMIYLKLGNNKEGVRYVREIISIKRK